MISISNLSINNQDNDFGIIMILIVIAAYLIGSVPSAFILVRVLAGKNITEVGSGNVGAMNSYESTGKKYIGVLVFIADFLKGLLPMLLLSFLNAGEIEMALAAIALIFGHNYSAFLKLKGGKGLATAVGIFAFFNLLPIVLWVAIWLLSYKLIFRDINKANIIATFTLFLIWVLPDSAIYLFAVLPSDPLLIKALITIVACLILSKHKKDFALFGNQSER